jgi:hypothetical protein
MAKNVEIVEKGDKLIITIDKTKSFGPSKSQKTTVVASTEGNIALGGGLFLGVNAYKK